MTTRTDNRNGIRTCVFSLFKCRLAGIILDLFVANKRTAAAHAVFRAPYSLLIKDWEHSVWPKIRPTNPNNKPKRGGQGDGYVIYRFMVNHQRLLEKPGYHECQQQLYDDPPLPPLCDPISGLPAATRTLKEMCEDAEFAKLNFWFLVDQQMIQSGQQLPIADLETKYREVQLAVFGNASQHVMDEDVQIP